MKRIVTFGETMLRFAPINKGDRIQQAECFLATPGGSESNVAVALSNLGNNAEFVSRFPDNEIAETIVQYLLKHKVETEHISTGGERVGIYYMEYGSSIRPWNILYDRNGSSFSRAKYGDFNWKDILKNACWLHSSGITPAISRDTALLAKRVLDNAAKKGITISIDLNCRNKLWRWARDKKEVSSTMRLLCKNALLITGNDKDFQNTFGIKPLKSEDALAVYSDIAKKVFSMFRNVKYIGIGYKKNISASEYMWTGILFVRDKKSFKLFKGPDYHITNVVDRLGVGDSFCAGLIHGLLHYKNDCRKIIDFATAMSGLKYTISGDACEVKEKDVLNVLQQKGTGEILR